jgi:hypothetical protein
MAEGIELQRVQRTTGGRIHLTPFVPESGPVVTLCDKTLLPGAFRATSAAADCRNCLRRAQDPARVSSAFFQSELGSELLQLSLQQARARRRELPQRAAPPPAAPAPLPPPPREEQPLPIPELRSRTPLRKTFENVYVSPDGVILRLDPDGRVREVVFTGPVQVRRRAKGIRLTVGDVVLDLAD